MAAHNNQNILAHIGYFNETSEAPIVISALTALMTYGVSHYGYLRSVPFFLSCPGDPDTLKRFLDEVPQKGDGWHVLSYEWQPFTSDRDSDFVYNYDGCPYVVVSTLERAIIEETEATIQGNLSLEDLYFLVEMLRGVNAERIQDLLERCKSIKTVRMFTYLCEKANLPWVSSVDPDVWTTSGDQITYRYGEILEPDYNIVVPLQLYNDDRDEQKAACL